MGLVARYHRRAVPRDAHDQYRDLHDADRSRVRRPAALSRVADSLDREHLQRVSDVVAVPGPGKVELTLAGDGPFLLEQWTLARKGRFSSEVFDVDLVASLELDAPAS